MAGRRRTSSRDRAVAALIVTISGRDYARVTGRPRHREPKVTFVRPPRRLALTARGPAVVVRRLLGGHRTTHHRRKQEAVRGPLQLLAGRRSAQGCQPSFFSSSRRRPP